jgi:protoheme IX farnesyltransferase
VIKVYLLLTKPGIVLGNLLAAVGGFMLAYSLGGTTAFRWAAFWAFMISTALIIASAGIINNYIDRNIDKKMERTKSRAFVLGSVVVSRALSLAVLLAICGFMLLYFHTNKVAFLAGIVGFLGYLIPYGLAKRHGSYGTLVGSIPGAVPPLAGYLSFAGRIDVTAIWLFTAMVLWQMPHFYAIAVRRLDDYKNASIPVLPSVHGVNRTVKSSLFYLALFVVAVAMVFRTQPRGAWVFIGIMTAMGAWWMYVGYKGFRALDKVVWARKFMKASVKVLLVWSLLMLVTPLL